MFEMMHELLEKYHRGEPMHSMHGSILEGKHLQGARQVASRMQDRDLTVPHQEVKGREGSHGGREAGWGPLLNSKMLQVDLVCSHTVRILGPDRHRWRSVQLPDLPEIAVDYRPSR